MAASLATRCQQGNRPLDGLDLRITADKGVVGALDNVGPRVPKFVSEFAGVTEGDVVFVALQDVHWNVERIGMDADGTLDSILLPTAGGPHAGLAAETAAALARGTGVTVTSAYVIEPDASETEYEQARSLLATAGEAFESGGAFETKLLESDEIVTALVEESADHDLTIIGVTREGAFQRFLFGTIPKTVATRAANTVIMAKRNLDVRSRLQQSFDKLRERATGRPNTMEQIKEEQEP